MPVWCAGSWAVGQRSQPTAQLTLARDQAPFGWTTFSAVGLKLLSPNAWPDLGVSTTATMQRTPASCAQVTSCLRTTTRSSVEDALFWEFVAVPQLQPRAGQQTPRWVTLPPLSHLLQHAMLALFSTQVHERRSKRDNRKGTMPFGQHAKSALAWAPRREGKHRTGC